MHKFFSKKSSENISRHFWERFWTFLDFWDFFDCSQNLEDSTLHGKLGKNFPKILPQNMFKTRLDTFGNNFEHFWKFDIFLIFLKSLEDSTLHGKLGKNFPKNLPQNMFKTRLDTFGNNFRPFWIFEYVFFENFRKLDPPWNTLNKIFSKKSPQNSSGHFCEQFWTFLEFWHFLSFFRKFSKSRASMEHWPWNFSKKLPQNMFKTHLDTFGNDFGHFWIFETFSTVLKI